MSPRVRRFSGGTGGTGGTARSQRRCRCYRRCDRVVPRQGWSPCPLQKVTGELIRYHLVPPRTFAPPRGTTCTTCTTKGESEQAEFTSSRLQPPDVRIRPTRRRPASAQRRARAGQEIGGREVVVLPQSDLVACKGSSRHITGAVQDGRARPCFAPMTEASKEQPRGSESGAAADKTVMAEGSEEPWSQRRRCRRE
jgi:hypothetical protein